MRPSADSYAIRPGPPIPGAAQRLWWADEASRAAVPARGIAYVLAFGFLLLVSLLISTVLNVASGWAGQWFALEPAVRVLSEVLAFAICAALFTAGRQVLAQDSAHPHARAAAAY